MAALSTTTVVEAVITTATVVSDVTAIASGALEEKDPEASKILGWVSFATGIVGLAGGIRHLTKATKLTSMAKVTGGTEWIELRTVEEFDDLPPVEVGQRNFTNARWHVIEKGSTRVFAPDATVSSTDVMRLQKQLVEDIPSSRRIVIMTGGHGDVEGLNYAETVASTIRRGYLRDIRFYDEDVALMNSRTEVVDTYEMTYDQMKKYMTGDSDVILAYCYARNDQALRKVFDLPPVISQVEPTDIFDEIFAWFLYQ